MSDRREQASFGWVMAVYLTGLAVGGLYVGMVAPVRTVIQADFGIGDELGIWIITIYTLFYAALIPVIGKLADRHGRKRVFCVCMGVFACGATLCGLAGTLGSAFGVRAGFALLLFGRVVQAVGAGGIIPVASAAMGSSAPPEKRGLALGLAAAVSGLANAFGSGIGSVVIGLIGTQRWELLFWLCLPLCAFVIVFGMLKLPQGETQPRGRMDVGGSALFVLLVVCLLLFVQGLDFTYFGASFVQPRTWLPLLASVVLGVVFVAVERRATDPVFHREYLSSRPIMITMVASFFIGAMAISLTIVPEVAEFVMDMPVGSGGYYVLAVGAFSLVGPPLGGKLIDRIGPKPVVIGGLSVAAVGYMLVALCARSGADPTPATLVAALCVVGLGFGFAMGAPTNYMILENTDPAESSSAVASVALVRQIGTSVAPAVFVGFIAAGSAGAAGAAATSAAGYVNMLLSVSVCCVIAIAVLAFYHSPSKRD